MTKPCPFCGGAGTRIYVSPNESAKAVGCETDGCCSGPWVKNTGTDDAAEDAWNRRTAQPARWMWDEYALAATRRFCEEFPTHDLRVPARIHVALLDAMEHAAYTALAAEREARKDEARDAARHRWWRVHGAMAVRGHPGDPTKPEWLDEAIDAAMQPREGVLGRIDTCIERMSAALEAEQPESP